MFARRNLSGDHRVPGCAGGPEGSAMSRRRVLNRESPTSSRGPISATSAPISVGTSALRHACESLERRVMLSAYDAPAVPARPVASAVVYFADLVSDQPSLPSPATGDVPRRDAA